MVDLGRTQTNTQILENKRLKKIQVQKDGVMGTFEDDTTINAEIIIGCDGANSVVRRQPAKPDFEKTETANADRAYYKGIEGMKPNANEFHFFKELLPGYLWIFPLENGWANVGFGILEGTRQKLKLRQTLNEIINTRPGLSERFRNARSM